MTAMNELQIIEMFAGTDGNGQAVVEKLQVLTDEKQQCRLVKSPAFVKGVASGDKIKFNPETQQFELSERSGNLCIRVFSRTEMGMLSELLTPEMEKLGGELDIETSRLLVYSIHVSCGFSAIESLLEKHVKMPNYGWMYGNVYDPNDGITPLNWWHDILKPQ